MKRSAGELYYLRLLLSHIRGESALSLASLQSSASEDDHHTFQQLARELGLLQDDSETASMLTEAIQVASSTIKLCEVVAEILFGWKCQIMLRFGFFYWLDGSTSTARSC